LGIFFYLLYLLLNIILFDYIHEENHIYHLFQKVAAEVAKTGIDRAGGVESKGNDNE
jgi:hypothetical protein